MTAVTQDRKEARIRFPIAVLAGALVLTAAVLLCFGWSIWHSYEDIRIMQTREFRLQQLAGRIRHLDEVLTMSTRMAVATGDPQWEDRYHECEPILKAAIREVLQAEPEFHVAEGIRQTDAANRLLVDMEYRSFELLRNGRKQDASALISSAEYANQQESYHRGLDKSLVSLQESMQNALESRRRHSYQVSTALLGVLPIVLVGWLYTLRTLRTYLVARTRVDQALRTAHTELEDRIEERTVDLVAANKRLQEEMAERKSSEEALRASEERYYQMFELQADGVVVASLDGTVVDANRAASSMFGYSHAEFIGLAFEKLLRHDYQHMFGDAVDAISNGKPFMVEGMHMRKDTSEIYVEVRVAPFEHDGKPHMLAALRDITERQLTVEALRDSSRKLVTLAEERETLLKHTRDFVYRHDTQGVFNYLSPSIERITGRTIEEWRKHYSTYMTDNPINEKVYAYTEETLRTGTESPPYLVEVLHKDGHRIMLEVNEQAYFDHGKVAGIVGVARDVTDRVHAEQALRASEQRLQGILDNTTAIIYVKDQNGRYVLVNRRFEDLFHVPLSDLYGKTDYDIFSKEQADAFGANDKLVLQECRSIEFEETALHDGRKHTYISLKFPLYDMSERPYAVCGISTDITERHQARHAMQKAKEAAEAASKAKSTFLANVSHEIRTPIMAMLGAAELISYSDNDRADPDRLDVILRSGRHLLSLVEDLLDVSRAERGKLEIRHADCSLPELMADVEAVVTPLHHDLAVDFRVTYETPIPTRINTDPTRLKQALVNVISNALKFTETGHVCVRVRVDRDADDPRMVVDVEDTGRGIPSSDLKRIFDIFTQLERGTSTVSMGIGLGLPLAKWIAENLGGSLEAASVVGQGSTFTIRVATGPIADVDWLMPDEASLAHASVRTERADTGTRFGQQGKFRLQGRLLLAEDADDLRELIADVLTESGVDVTAVADGEEAIKTAMSESFDLVLMDVRMPKLSGLDATAELRRRGCLIPIIALTASAAPDDRQQILKAGFDDLWPKPISMERIVQGVADYLGASPNNGDGDESSTSAPHDRPTTVASAAAEFSQSLVSRMEALRSALEENDMGRVHNILHQLVGTSGTLGYMSISREAAELLSKLKSGACDGRPEILRPLEDLIGTIVNSHPEDEAVETPTPANPSRSSK